MARIIVIKKTNRQDRLCTRIPLIVGEMVIPRYTPVTLIPRACPLLETGISAVIMETLVTKTIEDPIACKILPKNISIMLNDIVDNKEPVAKIISPILKERFKPYFPQSFANGTPVTARINK